MGIAVGPRHSSVFDVVSVRRHYVAALCITGVLAIVSFVTLQFVLLAHELNLRVADIGNEQMLLFQRSGMLTRNSTRTA